MQHKLFEIEHYYCSCQLQINPISYISHKISEHHD